MGWRRGAERIGGVRTRANGRRAPRPEPARSDQTPVHGAQRRDASAQEAAGAQGRGRQAHAGRGRALDPPPGGAAAAGRSRPRPAANSPQAAHTAPSPGSRKGDGLWPCGDYTVRSTRSTLPACTHVVHVRRYGPIHAYGWIQ
jgi:hypothetical protein